MKTFSVVFAIVVGFMIAKDVMCQNTHPQTKAIDPANMDLSVKPCDDFFHYANGAWLKNNPIPAAFDQWGSFNVLADHNSDVLHEILEDAADDKSAPAGSNKKKIGDFYSTGMDSAAIEALGWKPIAEDLNRIAAIKDMEGIQTELSRAAILIHSLRYLGLAPNKIRRTAQR